MTLPEIAVKRPIGTLMLLVSVFVLGVIALSKLELAFMPESEQTQLFVVMNYQNASPKAIERMIIKPLEETLASVNGLEHMRSFSDSNGGRVMLAFGYDADMGLARAEIHQRIDRIKSELPADLEKIIISGNWNPRETGETIMEARLSSGRDLSKNYELLERKIVKPLERIAGVAVVSLDGVNPREVRINLKLDKLRQYNLNAQQIWSSLAQNNQNAAIGILRSSTSKITLRAIGALSSIDAIGKLPIAGTPLKLNDIAEITFQEPPLEYGRHLDGNFAIGLNVAKESSANTITITESVHQKIAQMQSDPELEGINFLVWQDQGKEIKNTLLDLRQTGVFGAILACIVLFLFLRKVSTTLVAVSCIPFSLIAACGVIWLQGKSLNTITLLGLIVGLGMLVDNAVVIMENIDRYQKKGYPGRVAALLGAKEVSIAVMTATLTSIIVFLPMIFSKPTQMNVVLQELGLTICFTLTASLLISQLLIPLAATRLLNKDETKLKTPIIDWLQWHYQRILEFTLHHRWLAIVLGFGVLLSTIYPLSRINFNFDAAPTDMFIGIDVDVSEPLSLVEKEKIITRIEQSLEPYKEAFNVESIYSWWSETRSITRLYMKSGFQNEQAMNQVRRQLPDVLPAIAGVALKVQDNGRFWQRNSGKRVAVQLMGSDSETLSELAEQALDRIESVPGLFDLYTTARDGQLELHANLDRLKMANYGVPTGQPAKNVEMTFRGQILPRFKSENGEVPMQLILGESEQTSVQDLKSLTIDKPEGHSVMLDNIASFSMQQGPGRINRDNKVSSVWIGGRFEEGKRDDYRDQLIQLLTDMALPQGYQWEFNANWRAVEDSEAEFVLNLMMALGLIFAVMASLFESMRQALALMISLPFALAGAFWTLYWFGVDFDQPASVAVLLLLGIVVNNGIVMIEHINLYRRDGWGREKAMIQGGKERLRPIIMTALTTLVGLIPIVIQQPSLGGVYYYSMAYVIIGGLLFSTLLTSLFLPATIALVEDGFESLTRWAAWSWRKLSRLPMLISSILISTSNR